MNKNMKKDNKGFSLVELIIVIAIMAILIGVVAVQVIPYLEKSRVGKDRQTVDTVYSAFQTAIASTEGLTGDIKLKIDSTNGLTDDSSTDGTGAASIIAEMIPVLGASNAAGVAAGTVNKLASSDAKTAGVINLEYTHTTKRIVVSIAGTDIKSENKAQ